MCEHAATAGETILRFVLVPLICLFVCQFRHIDASYALSLFDSFLFIVSPSSPLPLLSIFRPAAVSLLVLRSFFPFACPCSFYLSSPPPPCFCSCSMEAWNHVHTNFEGKLFQRDGHQFIRVTALITPVKVRPETIIMKSVLPVFVLFPFLSVCLFNSLFSDGERETSPLAANRALPCPAQEIYSGRCGPLPRHQPETVGRYAHDDDE